MRSIFLTSHTQREPDVSMLAVLGPARGGGSSQIAQGGGVSAEVEAVERALRQAEVELLSA